MLEKQGELLVNQGQIKQDKHDIDSYFKKSLAFKWKEEFSEVFENSPNGGGFAKGFDVVVGNPPYVDSETMTKYSPQDREYLTKNYEICKGNWGFIYPVL